MILGGPQFQLLRIRKKNRKYKEEYGKGAESSEEKYDIPINKLDRIRFLSSGCDSTSVVADGSRGSYVRHWLMPPYLEAMASNPWPPP